MNRRALRKWLIRAALVVSSLACVELGLRWVMFSDLAGGWSFARKFRQPELYASQKNSDLYWQLQSLFLPPDQFKPPWSPHEKLGWTSGRFVHATYEHVDRSLQRGRRLVLLYGDSYAQCNTSADDCFQGLLQRSAFASQLCLLNYGVGGYGFDQVLMLMRDSLDRYAAENPIVIIGILVGDDFDRCVLSYRCWPKPRFELVDGTLEPRATVTMQDYWKREHLMLSTCFLERFVTHRLLPSAWAYRIERVDDMEARKQALTRALLDSALHELEVRGLEHAVLLFFDWIDAFRPERNGWREPLIREVLARHGTRIIDTREVIVAESGGDQRQAMQLFGGSPRLQGHYNPHGNAVVFRAFESAFEHQFGLKPKWPPLDIELFASKVTPGETSSVVCDRVPQARASDLVAEPRLCMRVGEGGPTAVEYDLQRHYDAFHAMAGFAAARGAIDGSVELSVWLDGERASVLTLHRADPPQALDVVLSGASRLTIRAGDAGDGISGDNIVLGEFRIE